MKLHLEKILKELKPYRERKAVIDPEHAALLVIDIQNFFSSSCPTCLGEYPERHSILQTREYSDHLHTAWPHRSSVGSWSPWNVVGSGHPSWDKGLAVSSRSDRRIKRYRSS